MILIHKMAVSTVFEFNLIELKICYFCQGTWKKKRGDNPPHFQKWGHVRSYLPYPPISHLLMPMFYTVQPTVCYMRTITLFS